MEIIAAILSALALILKPIAEALLPVLLEKFNEPKTIAIDAQRNQDRRDEFADVVAAHELRVLASESHDSP